MFRIIGNDIFLSRGDTAGITIKVRDASGAYYRLEATDQMRLTVKRSVFNGAPVIEKTTPVEEEETISGETIYKYRFDITTNDTAELDFGLYIYDVRLDFGDGNRCTIVEPSIFKIESVVSNAYEPGAYSEYNTSNYKQFYVRG